MLVKSLSQLSHVEESRLLYIAATASARYKTYTIPKRSGGVRVIHHPSRELKAIQRWIIAAVFNRLPLHHSATAYHKGASIRLNATAHQFSNYTTRFDFQDFFPSFSRTNLRTFFLQKNGSLDLSLSEADIGFICDVVCRHNQLTIGAPSSPSLTNAMMFEFDDLMHQACKHRDIIYTRYADDIFLSSFRSNNMNDMLSLINQSILRIPYLSLKVNKEKTAFLSRKSHRSVTGVVITSDRRLSIGRERKRLIRSLIHKWQLGQIDGTKLDYLRGLLSYAIAVEPALEASLRMKYGHNAIIELLRRQQVLDTSFEDEY